MLEGPRRPHSRSENLDTAEGVCVRGENSEMGKTGRKGRIDTSTSTSSPSFIARVVMLGSVMSAAHGESCGVANRPGSSLWWVTFNITGDTPVRVHAICPRAGRSTHTTNTQPHVVDHITRPNHNHSSQGCLQNCHAMCACVTHTHQLIWLRVRWMSRPAPFFLVRWW